MNEIPRFDDTELQFLNIRADSNGVVSPKRFLDAVNYQHTILTHPRFAPHDKETRTRMLNNIVTKYNVKPSLVLQLPILYCGRGYLPPGAILATPAQCRNQGAKWGDKHGIYSSVQ
jgi:hypothetical protein